MIIGGGGGECRQGNRFVRSIAVFAISVLRAVTSAFIAQIISFIIL